MVVPLGYTDGILLVSGEVIILGSNNSKFLRYTLITSFGITLGIGEVTELSSLITPFDVTTYFKFEDSFLGVYLY